MRLVCPNCGAQYEVDDQLIPESGRDVQCSNCGHAWFQQSPDQDEELAEELGFDTQGEPSMPDYDPDPEEWQDPGDAEDEPDEDDEPPAEETVEEEPAEEEDLSEASARQELDPALRDLLREEAERELTAREHEREQIETQADLGLEDATDGEESRERSMLERMARLRGLDESDAEPEGEPGPRRELLPDIEEINSSLEASHDSALEEEYYGDDEPSPKGGFRRGFLMVLILALIVVALYSYAPLISAKFPQAEAHLTFFVETVDKARAWLDGLIQLAIGKMQDLSGGG